MEAKVGDALRKGTIAKVGLEKVAEVDRVDVVVLAGTKGPAIGSNAKFISVKIAETAKEFLHLGIDFADTHL